MAIKRFKVLNFVEVALRIWFVNIPTWINQKFPEILTLCRLFFLYIMLQLVGLVWACLISAGNFIAIAAARFASDPSKISTTKLAAKFYVYYAAFRVIFHFGYRAAKIGWESMRDFPRIRLMMLHSKQRLGELNLAIFSVLFFMSALLLFSPMLCDTSNSPDDNGYFTILLLRESFLPDISSPLVSWVCNASLVQFLRLEHESFRRMYQIFLILLLLILTQCLLHQFANWDHAWRQVPLIKKRLMQLCLLPMVLVTVMLFVVWGAQSLEFIGSFVSFSLLFMLKHKFLPNDVSSIELPSSSFLSTANRLAINSVKSFVMSFHNAALFNSAVEQMDRNHSISSMLGTGNSYSDAFARVCSTSCQATRSVFHGSSDQSCLSTCSGLSREWSLSTVYVYMAYKWTQIWALIERLSLILGIEEHTSSGFLPSTMIFLWAIWLCIFAFELIRYEANVIEFTQKSTKHLLSNVRMTFFGLLCLIFLRGFTHSDIGFLDAHLEVTLLTISFPVMLVVLYAITSHMLRASSKMIVLFIPLSVIAAIFSGYLAELDHPGLLSLVGLHFLGKLIQFFGQEPFSASDLNEEDSDQSKDANTPPRKSSDATEGRDRVVSHSEHSSRASFSMKDLRFSTAGVLSRKIVDPVLVVLRTIVLPTSYQSLLIAIGTALMVTVSLCVLSFAFASYAQEQVEWYPNLINEHDTASYLEIDHVNLAKMRLTKILKDDETKYSLPTGFTRYAACDMSWHGLSLLDLSLLSEAAYFDNVTEASSVISHLFPNDDSVNLIMTDADAFQHESKSNSHQVQFMEVKFEKLNTSVIALRGTDVGRLADLVEVIKLYTEPVSFQLLAAAFPTIRLWPERTSSSIVEGLSTALNFFGMKAEAEYYKPLLDYAQSISGRNIVVTGHSLGGGLARIVSSVVPHASSVAFAPPGIGFAYKMFKVQGENAKSGHVDHDKLHHKSTAVWAEHDIIPMLDNQVGMVQRILCDEKNQAQQNACHMLEGTICNLLKHCGDERFRFSACQFDYDLSPVIPLVTSFIIENFRLIGPLLLASALTFGLAVIPELVL